MELCKYCMNLNLPSTDEVAQSRKKREFIGDHAVGGRPEGLIPHVDITSHDLNLAATTTGCEACLMLRNVLRIALGDDFQNDGTITCTANSESTLDVTVSLTERIMRLELYTHTDSPSKWPIIGPARGVSFDSSDDDCFDLTASWIDDCVQNHQDCRSTECTPLPTRVIDVASENIDPHLYISKQENAKYVTLSHCWGAKMPMKTTLATLEERQRGVKFHELPKTFRDAITITRRLKVQYIWIDSLCIIQDSSEDWTREAATMGRVYRNGYVCIAADGAADSSGGCFVGNEKRNFDLGSVKCPGADDQPSTIYFRNMPTLMSGYGFAHIKTEFHPPPCKLDTRGWVLQEQALSLRTLHYTIAELAWDCVTCVQCECTISPAKVEADEDRLQLCACKSMMLQSVKSAHPGLQELSRWPNLVELFTQRELSFESDRLHALSGIASFLRHPHDRYLGGIWANELPLGLLWRTKPAIKTQFSLASNRHKIYHAPTWSWASVTGEVEFIALPGRSYSFKLVPRLSVIEINYVPTGENPFGPAKTAFLKVFGYLFAFKSGSDGRELAGTASDGSTQARFYPRRADHDTHDTKAGEGTDMRPQWLLLVANGERRRPGFSTLEGFHYLVLQETRHGLDTYERKGYLHDTTMVWDDWPSQNYEKRTLTLF